MTASFDMLVLDKQKVELIQLTYPSFYFSYERVLP